MIMILDTLNTIDFIDSKQTLCLRTHSSEKKHLIVQLGSACPILAGKFDPHRTHHLDK